LKYLTKSERIAFEILKKSYPEGKIHYNPRGSPDFILPDKRIDVKRVVASTIYFTRKQWEELEDNDEIWILNGEEVEAIVPFSEVKKAYESGKGLFCNKKSYRILITEDVLRINITDELTKRRLLAVCKEMNTTPIEALRRLLDIYENLKTSKSKVVVY